MSGIFDPAIFDDAIFDVSGAVEPEPPSGGYIYRTPMRVTVRLEPEDQEEAALLVALLRHRFRL